MSRPGVDITISGVAASGKTVILGIIASTLQNKGFNVRVSDDEGESFSPIVSVYPAPKRIDDRLITISTKFPEN